MNAFLAILKKELRSITREMTILIAIVIQLFIASFSSALLIGLLSVYDPESISAKTQTNLRVGVVTNDFNTLLVRCLQDHHLTVNLFVNTPDANRAFENHILDVILTAPDDTGETMNLQMLLPRSETFASFVLPILREPLKRYENSLRQERGAIVNYTDIPGLSDTTF